jgi:AraC-like DNA-binding protein
MNRRTASSAWVKGIATAIEAAGLDARALFCEAGMDFIALNNPAMRYPMKNICLLWELAAMRSNNPAIGLPSPGAVRPAIFDVVTYAMMSCENLHAGLERLVSHLPIVNDAASMTLMETCDGCWLRLTLYDDEQMVPRQCFEFGLVTVLNFFSWVTGQDIKPLAVELTHPAPVDPKPYRHAFRCPVRFGAPADQMFFSSDDLALPFSTSNEFLAKLHDQYVNERLDQLEHARIGSKTRELIVNHLPNGYPLRSEIAQALCMSERTLQRRLQDEGTSFHELVDSARYNLAQRYLGQSNLTLAQATHLLGFSDQSAFFRACKRWFEMSPTQYRQHIFSQTASVSANSLLPDSLAV